jgi:DNA polymerase-3 subunit epsilon
MREICLDTETTGLKPEEGHRIIEIGAVELHNHIPTGRTFHVYINPERDVPEDAVRVHGLTAEFLADKPTFAEIVDDFLAFIGEEAPLVIHNAAFDRKFLNWELSIAGRPEIPAERCIDTLEIARRKFPGAQNTLDALCRRFGVDNSARELHGALLDAQLLADVYIELIGGRQIDLSLAGMAPAAETPEGPVAAAGPGACGRGGYGPRPRPLKPRLTPADLAAHAAFIESLGENALWKRYAALVPGAGDEKSDSGGR